MAVQLACPVCKQQLQVPDTALGKNVRCQKCKHVFVAADPVIEAIAIAPEATAVSEQPAPSRAASARRPEYEDDEVDMRSIARRPASRSSSGGPWILLLVLGLGGAAMLALFCLGFFVAFFRLNAPMQMDVAVQQPAQVEVIDDLEELVPIAPLNGGVRVGILHSLTGTMAISETALKDAEMLAIEEINAAGGVLGRRIEPIIEDAKSDFTKIFPDKAKKLIVRDQVAVVFGCWTSVSRKNVLLVFEDLNSLLFYPVAYEGFECSKNIVYTGGIPNQQVLPAIDWLIKEKQYKNFYLIGSDYYNPRVTNLIIAKHLQTKGLTPVAEKYTPFGHQDYATIVLDIKQRNPDVIVSMITGDSNIPFYNELAAQGVTADKIPVVSAINNEEELHGLDPAKVKGHYSVWNYFQSLDNPKNKAFVTNFRKKYGQDRVTNDPIAAAYAQVYLWKLAVEKAQSFDVDKVRAAFRAGIEFDAPEGRIKIDPKTQHTYRHFRVGQIRGDRQFDIVFESKQWITPEPFPQVAFPGWSCDWTKGGLIRGPMVKIRP